MNNNLTDITLILDRSGSMADLQTDVIGGINSFIKQQKECVHGEAVFTLFQFSTNPFTSTVAMETVTTKPIKEVLPLNKSDYFPNGGTALLDAIGEVVTKTGQRLRNLPEYARPSKVLIVIMTDGLENSSRKYGNAQIKEMLRHQQDVYNWEIVYLGANQDSFDVGAQYAIKPAYTQNIAYSSEGIMHGFTLASNSAVSCRSGGTAEVIV